eukprot:TRINITY_DN2381_c0_g1_i2.p1 TRINITY_DN2381_c0_g1~~TRINITY_DN2381_c0_g1_i2.p1  ORF type:complete len:179 (+),score=19.69 TRINITY_DN2381_c0_g1_i2:206-742(+)
MRKRTARQLRTNFTRVAAQSASVARAAALRQAALFRSRFQFSQPAALPEFQQYAGASSTFLLSAPQSRTFITQRRDSNNNKATMNIPTMHKFRKPHPPLATKQVVSQNGESVSPSSSLKITFDTKSFGQAPSRIVFATSPTSGSRNASASLSISSSSNHQHQTLDMRFAEIQKQKARN